MKKIFFFLVVVFLVTNFIFSLEYEYTYPLEFKENNLDGIDIYKDITDPLGWYKVYAEFACGLSPINLYSDLKINVIYNPDSVIQGESLLVKIILQPIKSNKHTIYSNFGVCAGVGSATNLFSILGGTWANGPGIGIDFNMNIESDDNPPFYPGEYAKGDDVVDFLSLIPDIASAGGGGKLKYIIDENGDTLPFYPNKDDGGGSASDVLGLFDILSLRLSGGFKISNGLIRFYLNSDGQYIKTNSFQYEINNKYDTLFLKVYVDSFAPQNSLGYIRIVDPYYRVDLYRRIGLCLQSFGITIASTYWIDEDFYEFLQTRDLTIPENFSYDERIIEIPIKVIGEPLYRADFTVTKMYIYSQDYWGNPTDFVHANVPTDIGIQYDNKGQYSTLPLKMKITVDNTYDTIVNLPDPNSGWYFYKRTFTTTGTHKIEAHINYDYSVNEIVTTNNKMVTYVDVVEPTKGIVFSILDTLGNKVKDLKSFYVSSNNGVKTYSSDANDDYVAYVPGRDTILVTAIPDSLSVYCPTSFYIETNNLPVTGNYIQKKLNLYSKLKGFIKNKNGDPIDSAKVSLGAYSVISDDSGYFEIEKVIPLPDTFEYLLKINHPVFNEHISYLNIPSGKFIDTTFYLTTFDTLPPSGSDSLYSNYHYVNGRYIVTSTKDPVMRFKIEDDYSGFYSVLISYDNTNWKEFKSDNPGKDSIKYISLSLVKPFSNGWTYFWYKFKDLAGNISASKKDSLYMIVEGPTGDFTLESSTVYSPSAILTLSSVDTLFPVKYVEMGVIGHPSLTKNIPYMITPVSLTLPDEPALYQIYVIFGNSENIWSDTIVKSITYDEKGMLVINNDDKYTNSKNVNVAAFPKKIAISFIDNNDWRGGVPLSQKFVPNTDRIIGVGINFENFVLDSGGVNVGIYTDTFDGMFNVPNRCLTLKHIDTANVGWNYIQFDEIVNVSPSEKYHLVLYTDLSSSSLKASVRVKNDDSSYPDGTLLYSPTYPYWYPLNVDMNFKIYDGVDSLWISNYYNLSNHTTLTSGYSSFDWTLTDDSGSKNVYAQFFSKDVPLGKISDGILLDITPPSNCSISINNGNPFTTEPKCTLKCYFEEDISELVSVKINGINYGNITPGNSILVYFSDTNEGTKKFDVNFVDECGNISETISKSIDYDKSGFSFRALFNDTTLYYIPSRYPKLYIKESKAIIPDSVRFSENIIDKGNFRKYQQSYQCTLSSDRDYHTLYIEVKDNYGKISKGAISAFVDSTPPSNFNNIVDEGSVIPYQNTLSFIWDGIAKDGESGLSSLYGKLFDGYGFVVDSFDLKPFQTGVTRTCDFDRYTKYTLRIYVKNNAGISGDSVSSDGIIFDTPPSSINLISPINEEIVSSMPTFEMVGHDDDPDTVLKFKVEITDDSSFSNIIHIFDMNVSTSLWSKNSYAPNEIASLTLNRENELEVGKKYFWRAYVFDPLYFEKISSVGSFFVGYTGIESSFKISQLDTVFKLKIPNSIITSKRVFVDATIPNNDYLKLYIVDVRGAKVKTLYDGKIGRGGFRFFWDIGGINEKKIGSGIFYIIGESCGKVLKKKVNIF